MASGYRSILLALSIIPFSISAQEYRAGTSSVSIEPDQTNISLHLGGYGAPRDGRFTLQWKNLEALSGITSISGSNDKLYVISNEEILWRKLSEKGNWTKAGNSHGINAIAASGGKLYTVNKNGELLQSDEMKIKWKKTAQVDRSVNSITVYRNNIYVANNRGEIWRVPVSSPKKGWSKIAALNNIVSLAANDRHLYALTGDGEVYRCQPEKKDAYWLMAAYRNNLTIREDIKQITIAGGLLYGIDQENNLYEGEHRTEGNLTARTMAITSGNNTVLIVSLDVCGINDTFAEIVKKEIYQKHKIPAAAVFINSTHTHFAPVSQNWLTWQPPNQLPDSLFLYSVVRKGILRSVDEAISAEKPARLYFGRGKTDIGYNRSLKDHPELYDSDVDVLKVQYTDNTESYLFLAACHPVFSTAGTLHYTISANYPGVARKLVEERTDTENSIFLQGTAGDINPGDNGEYISGEKLANEVISVLSRPMNEITGSISFFLDTINIPVMPWSREDIRKLRADNIDKAGDISAERDVKWSNLMLKYLDEGTMPKVMPVYYHTLNIGNWKLAGFSRETTTPYSFGVKKMWPGKHISVAGYTNDVSSYLPSTLHIRAKNYEGLGSFFWYGMPNTFPEGVEEIILGTIEKLAR